MALQQPLQTTSTQQPQMSGGQQPQMSGGQQPQMSGGQQPQQTQPIQQTQQTQSAQQGQQMEGTLDQAITPEMQQALQQFHEALKVCEWCADQCAGEGQEMAECLRLCRDVADLASLNARFITRDSSFGPDLAQMFISVAQECAQECSRHPHGHCQDCARVLRQATQTTQRMLQSLQSSAGTGTQGMQSQWMGGQSQGMGGQPQTTGGQPQTMGGQSQGMQTQSAQF